MYRLKVEAITPSTVRVDQLFEITFKFTNIHPSNDFPGIDINIRMIWANIDPLNIRVDRSFRVEALDPGELFEKKFFEKPRIDGTLLFYLSEFEAKAVNGNHVDFFLPDDNILNMGQIFQVVRVKSSEEVYQFWANIIAAGSLVLLIIFQLIGWRLQGFI